jgi:hypothetical protein
VFKIKTAEGRLERVAFLRLIYDPLNYIFINQAYRPNSLWAFFMFKIRKYYYIMSKYTKIIMTCGSVLASSLISDCCASGAIDLVAMEEGSQNNIQLQHQIPLQQELLPIQHDRVDVQEEVSPEQNHEDLQAEIIVNGDHIPMNVINYGREAILQSIRYLDSLSSVKKYEVLVAASLTAFLVTHKS